MAVPDVEFIKFQLLLSRGYTKSYRKKVDRIYAFYLGLTCSLMIEKNVIIKNKIDVRH